MIEFIAKYWLQWLFGIVAAALAAAWRSMAKWRKAKTAEDAATRKLLIALAHDALYTASMAALTRGEIDPDELDNIRMVYDAYHALGGNGTGTVLWERVQKLKIVERR